jgi:lactate dehydrogenase-like 2-hydroxyacid dehydrogenase
LTTDVLLTGALMPRIEERLRERYRVRRLDQAPDRAALLAETGPAVRAIVTTGHLGCDADLIAACPNLQVVGCFGVGYDGIDVPAAQAQGVVVTNTPDVLTDDVADLAIALMLMVCRRLVVGDRWVREGRWLQGNLPLAQKLSGRKLGIFGLGRIGKAVARRAEAFDMVIAYHGRSRQDVHHTYHADPIELARWADILCVVTPGGPATRHLVDARVMDALGPEGVLINVARGSVVDETALCEALAAGRLGGAGLDVFADEPRVPEILLTMENVVLEPHIASATVQTRTAMADLTVDNVIAVLEGRPPLTPVTEP